jgi:large subunit ribosomal protein L33
MSQDTLVKLQCGVCSEINYRTTRNRKRADSKKLELEKFCGKCRKHTTHKELKK